MITSKTYSKNLRKNQTEAEKLLWYRLRNKKFLGFKFRRQQLIGKYIVDFVNFERKIIIEVDGEQHNFKDRKFKDNVRTKWLTTQGFTIVRFWNNDILKDIEEVLEQIKVFITR